MIILLNHNTPTHSQYEKTVEKDPRSNIHDTIRYDTDKPVKRVQ
jgi:hypothetical protein